MREVEQAPESPGLYAWYASFRASPQDWLTRPDEGRDAAADGFLNLLREYASYFEPLPIALRGSAPYGGSWRGELELDHGLTATPEIGDTPQSDSEKLSQKDRAALTETINSQDGRRVLATLLSQATPFFSSPIYIGVAENLRQRLQQHHRNYTEVMEWLSENPNDTQIAQEQASVFGHRAAAKRIAMENLEVWVIDLGDLESTDLSVRKLRETARSAEWLLHRLFSPILGRQ
ncbi:hypothetical protein ACWC4J_26110 [Streptomyces sp. NPDC001356]